MTSPADSKEISRPLALPIKEACRVLGIGPTKLWELIGDGSVRTINIGRRRLVVYSSLESLVERPAGR
jgi:excisionase family DNA binding protein